MARRACLLPASARASSLIARTLTRANSAATKKALAASSRTTARIERYIGGYLPFPAAGGASLILGQDLANRGMGDVRGGERVADPPRQDEAQPGVLDLLVPTHGGQQLVGRERTVADGGQPCRQPEPQEVPPHPLELRRRAMAQPCRQGERLDHA